MSASSEPGETHVGRRADWRFLLPSGPRSKTLIIGPEGESGVANQQAWQWLADDGWTDEVCHLNLATLVLDSERAETERRADVILVRSSDLLAPALKAASETATIVVELGRSRRPAWRIRPELTRAGFTDQRMYLATPGVQRPLRLTPLMEVNGMRWLVSLLETKGRGRDAALRLLTKPASALLRTPIASVASDRLIIATRHGEHTSIESDVDRRPGLDDLLPPGCDDAAIMTSGHDDGSRVVVLPFGRQTPEPSWVFKISARPGFNSNVDDEVAVIASLSDAAGVNALDNLALPHVETVFDHGLLRCSKEKYAGRSTAADVCYRSPERQQEVLQRVLQSMTDLNLAVASEQQTGPWSKAHFSKLLQTPFGRYCELMGPQPELSLLMVALEERSEELGGCHFPQTQRHYDLGPWNVVFDGDRLTIIDWERAEPRTLSAFGPAGADQLCFAKYWLHIAMGTVSVDEELKAFEFLPSQDKHQSKNQQQATEALAVQLARLEMNSGFVPILAVYVWLEKAIYTIGRRQSSGATDTTDPGDAARYLQVLAEDSSRLLTHWPVI